MPQRLQDSKDHKEMIINCLKLMILCVFVPLWQNYTFRSGLNYFKDKLRVTALGKHKLRLYSKIRALVKAFSSNQFILHANE
jgi:hypothetical protein